MHSGINNSANDLLPLSTLLNCRTVVESQNFVTTGIMVNAEGELFEIEIHEFDSFELGEKVKVTVYSPAGIQTFSSMVLAKYEGAISVIQPPEVLKRFVEKRAHPRVNVKGSLFIYQIVTPQGAIKKLDAPMEASLRNISVSGIGFEAEYVPELERSARLDAVADVGFVFKCELEIARREKQEENWMYGASMRVVEPEMMRPLRALILRQQVEQNIKARKDAVSGK
jgi:hypothetical protein